MAAIVEIGLVVFQLKWMRLMMDSSTKLSIKIREINPHIVCTLCAGYFIDATTVIECLHTFCKSCIVKYLQTSNHCPTCNIKIHETHPLTNIRLDRTLQDIVRNIVPGIRDEERKRKVNFYTSRGMEVPYSAEDDCKKEAMDRARPNQMTNLSKYKASFRDDEQISLCVDVDPLQEDFDDFSVPTLQRRYLRCSVRAKCGHLIALLEKLIVPPDGFKVLIKCNGKSVSVNETMKIIWIAHWKQQKQPMNLFYRFVKGGNHT